MQMPFVSSQPFSPFFSQAENVKGTKYLCCMNGIWECSHFSLNGKHNWEAKLIIIALEEICLIHIVSTCALGIRFVDSHFARCIFIWRCRRIPTRLDPSPAKSLCQASLWLQVELLTGKIISFINKTDQIRGIPTFSDECILTVK